MQKTLRIYGKEKTSKSGAKFVVYSYYSEKKDKYYKVKFTRSSGLSPILTGYCTLVIDTEDAFVKKGRTIADFTENDIIFIKKVVSLTKDESTHESKNSLEDL